MAFVCAAVLLAACGNETGEADREQVVQKMEAVPSSGAVQEDGNYYWFYSEQKIEWQEAASCTITKGDTGEQRTLECTDASGAELMGALRSLALRDIAEEEIMGYQYCIRTYDAEGRKQQSFTICGDKIDIDGDWYEEALAGSCQKLVQTIDMLYAEQ